MLLNSSQNKRNSAIQDLQVLNLNNNSQSQGKIMQNTQQTPHSFNFHKIMFTISRKIKFGQAIYVCGDLPELGSWAPEKSFRLKWNQNDRWTGILLLTHNIPQDFQFKYLIADWENPSSLRCIWQGGAHNRKISLAKAVKVSISDDKWNMDKITFNLHVEKRLARSEEERYYVVGNISELGSWTEPKLMKKLNIRSNSSQKKQNLNLVCNNIQENTSIYTYTFFTNREKEEFQYFYIRKTQVMESERRPGRIFNFSRQNATHPQRKGVSYTKGDISINDQCSLNALKFSQITPNIYVGSYPKSQADILTLKQHGITTIFSIQTEKDFRNHGLSPHYFKLLCEENGVAFKRYSIEDMNNEDFISRAEGGVKIMRDLMKQGKVYVHCTAGIYRSPQMIALYLILFEQYSVEKAIQTLKENHPFAKPNSRVVREVIGMMRAKPIRSRNCL